MVFQLQLTFGMTNQSPHSSKLFLLNSIVSGGSLNFFPARVGMP